MTLPNFAWPLSVAVYVDQPRSLFVPIRNSSCGNIWHSAFDHFQFKAGLSLATFEKVVINTWAVFKTLSNWWICIFIITWVYANYMLIIYILTIYLIRGDYLLSMEIPLYECFLLFSNVDFRDGISEPSPRIWAGPAEMRVETSNARFPFPALDGAKMCKGSAAERSESAIKMACYMFFAAGNIGNVGSKFSKPVERSDWTMVSSSTWSMARLWEYWDPLDP